ncbi:DUF3427 domain-containing protein [Niallia circulans]
MLETNEITLEDAKQEILKYVERVDDDSIIHAFENLNQNYYDTMQKKGKLQLCIYENNKLVKTEPFKRILEKEPFRIYVEDCIMYGIFRYEKEFKETYYGIPHFKLYEQYQMIDAALLSNYRKIHSSFRGSGLLTNGNEYFLYIDLHKEEDIKESINYKDKIIDESTFQWQTPNSTSQSSDRGKNIIYNKERGYIYIYLFVNIKR